jgi:hypothetical protein
MRELNWQYIGQIWATTDADYLIAHANGRYIITHLVKRESDPADRLIGIVDELDQAQALAERDRLQAA